MTKPRPLYLGVRCCMSTNLCPDASSTSSLAVTLVSLSHVIFNTVPAQLLSFLSCMSPSDIPHSQGDGEVAFVSLSVRVGAKKGRHFKRRQSRFVRHLHNIIMFTYWSYLDLSKKVF